MKITVDTERNITQLFKIITEKIKETGIETECFIENYIIVNFNGIKPKRTLSKSIAEFILNEFEKEIALSIVKPFEIMKSEADEVLKLLDEDIELKEKRLNLIEREVFSRLSARHINVDGMVKFRLFDYKNELKFTVELLIDELLTRKSYDEFIGLMKYYAEIHTPVTDAIILNEKNGEYIITDIKGDPVNLKFDEEFADDLMPFDLSEDDLLISNLMSIMPGKIIFKNINTDKPIINTISKIFDGRIMH